MQQHQKRGTNWILAGILVLAAAHVHPLFAVDEEYFIPYTDTYGYVYDPETGTYIKQDPGRQADKQADEDMNTAAPDVGTSLGPGPATTATPATPVSVDATPGSTAPTDKPTVIIAGVLLILGMVVIITRFFRKTG